MTSEEVLGDIMSKGMTHHYSPETLAVAEKLYARWASFFKKSARAWNQLTHVSRIAWCEVATLKMTAGEGGHLPNQQ